MEHTGKCSIKYVKEILISSLLYKNQLAVPQFTSEGLNSQKPKWVKTYEVEEHSADVTYGNSSSSLL